MSNRRRVEARPARRVFRSFHLALRFFSLCRSCPRCVLGYTSEEETSARQIRPRPLISINCANHGNHLRPQQLDRQLPALLTTQPRQTPYCTVIQLLGYHVGRLAHRQPRTRLVRVHLLHKLHRVLVLTCIHTLPVRRT